VGDVTNDLEIIGEQERVALLRQGIVVLSAEADETGMRVCVAGGHEEWVQPAVLAQLGPDVDVDVCGRLPRVLRPRLCAGYKEREPGRLQLRYVLVGDEHLDQIVVAENDRTVVVFATICTSVVEEVGDAVEGPWHVYLDRPLGDRTVIDGFGGEPVPYKDIYPELKRKIARMWTGSGSPHQAEDVTG
jgi:hypothetical protein